MANSVDPDQMLHSAASDLGLHCLQMSICPNTSGYYGTRCYTFDFSTEIAGPIFKIYLVGLRV